MLRCTDKDSRCNCAIDLITTALAQKTLVNGTFSIFLEAVIIYTFFSKQQPVIILIVVFYLRKACSKIGEHIFSNRWRIRLANWATNLKSISHILQIMAQVLIYLIYVFGIPASAQQKTILQNRHHNILSLFVSFYIFFISFYLYRYLYYPSLK